MWPKDLSIDVSRESLDALETYQRLLFKWQKAINLVSEKTLQESGIRHFADSAQLAQYINSDVKRVMDWGSGAGFPGAVLGIMMPDIDFTCVESDERKCQFLRTVSRETSATIRIENRRIEAMVKDTKTVPDLITARALKPVKVLLDYAKPFIEEHSDLNFLLLKGEQINDEISEASHYYDFSVDRWPSVTDSRGVIIRLSGIKIRP
ncbi:MAG: 16S rRNA (guanine(527)-N(7))-methyltransferase RsmG [Bdellovibrionales bacterium]